MLMVVIVDMVMINLLRIVFVRSAVLVTVVQADKKHQQKTGENCNKLDDTFPNR